MTPSKHTYRCSKCGRGLFLVAGQLPPSFHFAHKGSLLTVDSRYMCKGTRDDWLLITGGKRK